MKMKEGDYLASMIVRKDDSIYISYLRVLKLNDPVFGHIFVDQEGARVTMQPELAEKLLPLPPWYDHPEIDLEPWR